ncbi:MAG: carboxypeptidase-like regulatory domain-containing protein [Acidobacteriota bacterium]
MMCGARSARWPLPVVCFSLAAGLVAAGLATLADAAETPALREVVLTIEVDPRLSERPDLEVVRLVVERADASSTRPAESVIWRAWGRSDVPLEVQTSVIEVPAGESVRLRLDTARGSGLWSSRVEVPTAGDRATVHLVPAAVVAGRLETVGELEMPRALEARVTPSAESIEGAGAVPGFAATSDDCTLSDDTFICRVPALATDLRLAADDVVPHFVWGLEPAIGEVARLGTLRLRRGASISGYVVPLAGGGPVEVVAEPQISGWLGDPAAKTRMAARSVEITADARGFFQLAPLAEGAYTLTARQQGALPTTRADVAVRLGDSVELGAAIPLREPQSLDLVLTPATDPRGEPWRVSLGVASSSSTVLRTVADGVATAGGFFRADSLAPGDHRLFVDAADGSRWLADELRVEPTDELLTIEIPHVAFEGEVLRGDEGVEVALVFGSTQGARRVAVRSDADGRFGGFLPRAGTWAVDLLDAAERPMAALEPVTVEEGDGGQPAWIGIQLPDTRIDGRVVDDEGEPVAGASVLALRLGESSRRESMVETDDDGLFSLAGLEPGAVEIQASEGERTSAWQTVDVVEGTGDALAVDAPIELALRDTERLTGTVVARGGPVPGAQLIVRPIGPAVTGIDRFVADAGGRFALRVSAETQALDVLLDAPGFALGLHRITLPAEEPIRLEVSTEIGSLQLLTGGGRPSPHSTLRSGGASIALGDLVSMLRQSRRLVPADGAMILPSLAPGVYAWCDEAAGASCPRAVVRAGDSARLQLESSSWNGSAEPPASVAAERSFGGPP